MLEAMPGFVKNAVRNGDSWDITTVVEGYFYGPLDIAIGPDDVPHITYHDHQDERQFRPEVGDAVHAYQAPGGEWQIEAAFGQGHDGWDNRITVDADGRPHMSAIDPLEFSGDGVTYYRRNGPGDWTVESIGSGELTYKYSTSIAVAPDGIPYITYYDQGGKDLALARRGDSGWTIAHIDTDGDAGLFSSLIIDADGRFHVSYFQKESASSGTVKYATSATGDSDWAIQDIDTLDRLAFGFIGARNITSVAIDPDGNPWIAYSDEARVMLAIWRGSEWQIETVVESSAGDLGQLVSLKLDSAGNPHIAYFKVTSRGPLNGVIIYAKGTPSP